MMKRIHYASGLMSLFALQSAIAAVPVTMSGPSPAIGSSYSSGSSNTFTYTITNNVPKMLPITVSGLSGPVSRTTVANDCGSTLPAGTATCNIGILIMPASSNAGQSYNQTLSVNYQGRTPLTGNIAFTVPSSTPPSTNLLIYVTTAYTTGNLGGVTGADVLCQADAQCPVGATCKAMLADGVTRTANPVLNWVLQPSTQYVNISGQTIGTTTTGSIFTFPLTNAISSVSNITPWTGLNADWTSSAANCTAWTTASGGVNGELGVAHLTTSTAITAAALPCSNITNQSLYCAQQP